VNVAAIGLGALACDGAGARVAPSMGGADGQRAEPAPVEENYLRGNGGAESLAPSGAVSPIEPVLPPRGAGGDEDDDAERRSELDGLGGGGGNGGSGAESAGAGGTRGGSGGSAGRSMDPEATEERRYALVDRGRMD
jgi:hypothetical protein